MPSSMSSTTLIHDRSLPYEADRAMLWPAESAAKRSLDLALAAILLVVSSPVMLVCMALVKLTSSGPAIYKQTRLGRGRRPFTIYKIRTMANNNEAATGARWATVNDPRITTIGRFLRASHLDELPQLWNIVRGEMSLVGPRPERPEFISKLELSIDNYAERMQVRPGVTGLAQVHLPPDVDLESVRRKLVYDRYYVANATLWLDLRLLIVTGMYILGIPFRVSCTALQVPVCEFDAELARPDGCCAVSEAPVAVK
jgi:lipopolysaccharide/colanic/teichoic acid biosynthesis glycosyltransferase